MGRSKITRFRARKGNHSEPRLQARGGAAGQTWGDKTAPALTSHPPEFWGDKQGKFVAERVRREPHEVTKQTKNTNGCRFRAYRGKAAHVRSPKKTSQITGKQDWGGKQKNEALY